MRRSKSGHCIVSATRLAAPMGRRASKGAVVIQANHGLTMIRLAELFCLLAQRGCTDTATALTALSMHSALRLVLVELLGRCKGCAAGTQTAHPAYLVASACSRQPILQRKSFAIGDLPSKRKPGSRDVPGSDPSTNTPPARCGGSCAWLFHLNHSDGLCCTKKIKAVDKFVLDGPCDHFSAENIRTMRDRTFGVG